MSKTCEECGSTDIAKSDIGYTCRACGQFLAVEGVDEEANWNQKDRDKTWGSRSWQKKLESWDLLQKRLFSDSCQLIQVSRVTPEAFFLTLGPLWFRLLAAFTESPPQHDEHGWIKMNGWPKPRITWSLCFLALRILRVPMSISNFQSYVEEITKENMDQKFLAETKDIADWLDLPLPSLDPLSLLRSLNSKLGFPDEIVAAAVPILDNLDMTALLPTYDFRTDHGLEMILLAIIFIATQSSKEVQVAMAARASMLETSPVDCLWAYSKIGRALNRKTYERF